MTPTKHPNALSKDNTHIFYFIHKKNKATAHSLENIETLILMKSSLN